MKKAAFYEKHHFTSGLLVKSTVKHDLFIIVVLLVLDVYRWTCQALEFLDLQDGERRRSSQPTNSLYQLIQSTSGSSGLLDKHTGPFLQS